MRKLDLITFFTTATLLSSAALGQVNTEAMRSWDEEGFSGSIDFSLNMRTGNVELLQAGSGLKLQYATMYGRTSTASKERPKLKDLVYLIGSFKYGSKSNEVFVNNAFGHLRWTRMWIPWFGSEIFGQFQYNEFINLEQRWLGGGGVRVTLLDESFIEANIGSAYMLEYEALDLDDETIDARTLAHRWSSYVSLKVYLAEPKVQLVNTFYVQPRLSDFNDLRVLDEAELELSVTKMLKLAVSLSVRYNSRPPPDVEKLDTTLQNKIRLSF